MLRKLPFFDFETQIFASACFSSQRTAGREGRSMKRGRRHFFLFSSCFYLGNPGRGPSFTVLYWAGQDFLRFARKMEHIRATSAEVKPVWTSPTLTIFIRLHCFCSTRSKNMYMATLACCSGRTSNLGCRNVFVAVSFPTVREVQR